MSFISNEKAMKISQASVEMEGFHVSQQHIEWCELLLNGKISMQEYIELVKQAAGV